MKTRLHLAAVVIVSLLAQPAAALARGQAPNATENWAAVKSVPVAAELEVKLTDGKSVKGRHVSSGDSEMVLSSGKAFKQIGRDKVRQVYVVLPNPRGNSAAKGAAFGSLLAFAGVNGFCDSSECIPPGRPCLASDCWAQGLAPLLGSS